MFEKVEQRGQTPFSEGLAAVIAGAAAILSVAVCEERFLVAALRGMTAFVSGLNACGARSLFS